MDSLLTLGKYNNDDGHIFNCQVEQQGLSGNMENLAEEQTQSKNLRKLGSGRTRIRAQSWQLWEIRKIFLLYNEFGSQWKIIESEFKNRSSNSIKNRFYTVIRALLKLLFDFHPQISGKLPHQISSKTILRFYEGRQQFSRVKGLGRRILKTIHYDVNSGELEKIVYKNEQEILGVYKLIYREEKPIQRAIPLQSTPHPNEPQTPKIPQPQPQTQVQAQQPVPIPAMTAVYYTANIWSVYGGNNKQYMGSTLYSSPIDGGLGWGFFLSV